MNFKHIRRPPLSRSRLRPGHDKSPPIYRFWGRQIWWLFHDIGISTDTDPDIYLQLSNLTTTHDPSTDYCVYLNVHNSFGHTILHLPTDDLLDIMFPCLEDGYLYLSACITRRRIMPLLARKRTYKKNHFHHLLTHSSPTLLIPPSVTILHTPLSFNPSLRTQVEAKRIPLLVIKSWKRPFDNERPKSKPRQGVG